MTQHLVATGAPVHAIEIDPAFIGGLRRLAHKSPNLDVVPADVLEADIAAIASGRRIRIYGNLPYYITSPILHRLFTFADIIDEIHVVIQTEWRNARRLARDSRLWLSLRRHPILHAAGICLRNSARRVQPPPEVSSALVTLRLPGERARLSLGDPACFLVL